LADTVLENVRQASLARSRSRDTHASLAERGETVAEPSASREGAVGLAIFRQLLRQLLSAPGTRIPALRAEAVGRLRRARDPLGYTQTLLDLAVNKRSTGGIDAAIDILAHTGELALEYAREFFPHDARRWSLTPTITSHVHEEVWEILLRAAARATPDQPDTLWLIGACKKAGNRGLRDAATLALYDLKTPAAKDLLADMARNDPDALIRRAARELLEDLGS
jgi:hypothetical protein